MSVRIIRKTSQRITEGPYLLHFLHHVFTLIRIICKHNNCYCFINRFAKFSKLIWKVPRAKQFSNFKFVIIIQVTNLSKHRVERKWFTCHHTSYKAVSSDSLVARTAATCASMSRRSLSLTLEVSQFACSITASAKIKCQYTIAILWTTSLKPMAS